MCCRAQHFQRILRSTAFSRGLLSRHSTQPAGGFNSIRNGSRWVKLNFRRLSCIINSNLKLCAAINILETSTESESCVIKIKWKSLSHKFLFAFNLLPLTRIFSLSGGRRENQWSEIYFCNVSLSKSSEGWDIKKLLAIYVLDGFSIKVFIFEKNLFASNGDEIDGD